MHIEEIVQKIVPVDQNCIKLAQARFDALIKPVGSLAKLEQMTSRYAGIICAYDKHEIDYPKRELLVWCDIKDADKAEKIMHAKMPVNILSAETGGRTSAFVVTATTEEEALEEGATLVQEMIVEHGLGLVGFGCMADKDNEMVRAAMAGGMLMAAAMKKGCNVGWRSNLFSCSKGSRDGSCCYRLFLCGSCICGSRCGRGFGKIRSDCAAASAYS